VISLPGVSAITHGSPSSDYVLGRARASYEFVQERWYAKPTLDLDLIRVHTGGYTENGSGAFDLSVDSSSQVLFAATPSVEIGARFTPTDTMSVRPYVTLGVTTLSNDTWTTTERILGGAMQVKTKLPPVVGVTAINLDLVDRNGLEVRLQYGANITGQSLSQTGFMRVGYRF
jgi:outer membrane autotransporter protein